MRKRGKVTSLQWIAGLFLLPFMLLFIFAVVFAYSLVWAIYNCAMFLRYGKKEYKNKQKFITWLED